MEWSKNRLIFEIITIYNQYILPNASQQVNLSYNCFRDMINIKDRFITFHLNDKKYIFNNCVSEIEKLINNSILNSYFIIAMRLILLHLIDHCHHPFILI